MAHKTKLHPDVVERILRRRGKMHVHDAIDPKRSALVVIDMQVAFLAPGSPSEVPMARRIVPNVNRLAAAMRAAGGTVVWVTILFPETIYTDWSCFLGGGKTSEAARLATEQLMEHSEGRRLWPELRPEPGDLAVTKNRLSAFLPGASDIEDRLRARGIDTVVIAGTLTNVCCDASARDAMMRNFNVIMSSDANASHTDAIHNSSLNSLAMVFCDVMTVDEIIEKLGKPVAGPVRERRAAG